MKNKKRRAFTLVELLAVIVILAVVLIIAIPQIMKTIQPSREGAMTNSIRLIAKNADSDYLSKRTVNENYNGSNILCTDVAKISSDYEDCTISYDSNGVATVTIVGASDGKFSGMTCSGTKDAVTCN